MKIKEALFVKSSAKFEECPPPELPEFAFIGRSNVGKSSLINMLTERKGLAKTSSKPGKTQLINHFLINGQWYLVDLPGYGWSKVSKATKASWGQMIENYLLQRKNLCSVFLLVDGRLEPQKIDYNFMHWMGESQIPFSIVFTKTDKLGTNKFASNLAVHKKKLLTTWAELPGIFISSALTFKGKEELLEFIESVNKTFDARKPF